ncbi:unnamed protein product [Caretta caretta]
MCTKPVFLRTAVLKPVAETMVMSFYKTPPDAKKLELPVGAPAHVQKRRPIYTYFAKEADLLPNPAFHPEIELKKQEEDFMESRPVVKDKKDRVRKNVLLALEEADSTVEEWKKSEYEDMATEGLLEDSHVENQPIHPESWKDGDIVMLKSK